MKLAAVEPLASGLPPVALVQPVELSVIIPTFNEAQNVREIVRRLDHTLGNTAWEAIFVDDNSPDGTAAVVKDVASTDRRVRCLKRVGRRGLAGACIEGMMASSAPYVAVMDADLQHDESILPHMLEELTSDAADLVVGSRYVPGGKADGLRQQAHHAEPHRHEPRAAHIGRRNRRSHERFFHAEAGQA
jgi:dolichol-phosphate mannosyltransferase